MFGELLCARTLCNAYITINMHIISVQSCTYLKLEKFNSREHYENIHRLTDDDDEFDDDDDDDDDDDFSPYNAYSIFRLVFLQSSNLQLQCSNFLPSPLHFFGQ